MDSLSEDHVNSECEAFSDCEAMANGSLAGLPTPSPLSTINYGKSPVDLEVRWQSLGYSSVNDSMWVANALSGPQFFYDIKSVAFGWIMAIEPLWFSRDCQRFYTEGV